MNKIISQIEKTKKEKRIGLMTHIVAGYPDIESSKKIAYEMVSSGVDFIEIQIPFSDPMADGPTIMQANKLALDNAVTPKDSMQIMKELSSEVHIPLIFMSYFNIISNYGVEKFCKDAHEVGCSGLIIPDMPLEEEQNENLSKHASENDLINIRLLSPASTEQRIVKNIEIAEGFVYFAGRKGTTGAKTDVDSQLKQNIEKVKKYTDLPIAVGFGISTAENLRDVNKAGADIAVIGSAIINKYNEKKIKGVRSLLKEMKKSL